MATAGEVIRREGFRATSRGTRDWLKIGANRRYGPNDETG